MHPVHLRFTTAFADYCVLFVSRFRPGRRPWGDDYGLHLLAICHARHYIHKPELICMEKLHSVRLLAIKNRTVLIENAVVVQ